MSKHCLDDRNVNLTTSNNICQIRDRLRCKAPACLFLVTDAPRMRQWNIRSYLHGLLQFLLIDLKHCWPDHGHRHAFLAHNARTSAG